MTANIEQLRALDERLEKATGPGREIDRALTELVYVWDERYLGTQEDDGSGWKPCKTGVWVDPANDKWTTTARDGREYTASIDAAMALVERCYPSLVIVMCRCADGRIQIREVWDAEDDMVDVPVGPIKDGKGGLPIVRALVAALVARAESAQ